MAKKKSPVHDARDSVSGDSLSFTGLVCIQDLPPVQAQSNYNIPSSLAKKESFEFGHVTQNTTTVCPINSNCPADILFYKGQLLPQPNQAQSLKQSNSVGNNSKRSGINDSNLNNGVSQHNNGHAKMSTNKKEATAGQSFGQKILRFATPCRDCRATETIPSTKSQALR
ncbi:hypothetical protein A4A49_27958 [Nicotiana attenuata]|uniref:Uncharacterized protein n=1 Tax=Nicotiana attenuata TaxID=49451 RepID=A0A1J6KBE4_NICAT|nr:hypothetical protein A4A49_27958 [Nicotiana attenuata]